MEKFTSIRGKTQPDAEIGENRLRECKWEPSVEFKIPKDWLSGVYLGKLTAKKEGVQSYIIFIVRDDRPCDLLFQTSDLTWQSYNSWPKSSPIMTRTRAANCAKVATGFELRKPISAAMLWRYGA